MPRSPKSNSLSVLVGALAALPFVACGTSSTAVDVASETSALVTAQCDAQATKAAVGACFDTFKACKAADGAVEADCKTALDACLPEGVPQHARHGRGGRGGDMDGGCPGGGRGGEGGGREGGRPEGLAGLFAPPDADGGVGHGRGGGRGHGGGGRGPVAVDDAAVQACQTANQACLDAGTDEATCREQTRTCMHDAFAAAFAARCQELADACAASGETSCDQITARCAEGVREPPAAGTCEVTDAGTP